MVLSLCGYIKMAVKKKGKYPTFDCKTRACTTYKNMMIEKSEGISDGPAAKKWGALIKRRKRAGSKSKSKPRSKKRKTPAKKKEDNNTKT